MTYQLCKQTRGFSTKVNSLRNLNAKCDEEHCSCLAYVVSLARRLIRQLRTILILLDNPTSTEEVAESSRLKREIRNEGMSFDNEQSALVHGCGTLYCSRAPPYLLFLGVK